MHTAINERCTFVFPDIEQCIRNYLLQITDRVDANLATLRTRELHQELDLYTSLCR
ncbi:hypothetical protein D3C76_1722360 [compost metagenome]